VSARGFTLVEILVATLILSVGIVAVASGLHYAIGGVEVGRGETAAVFLAEQRLELLRARPSRTGRARSWRPASSWKPTARSPARRPTAARQSSPTTSDASARLARPRRSRASGSE